MSTLKLRINQAFEHRKALSATRGKPTKIKLAIASGVKASSVTQWFDGHTKNIKGDALLLAAEYLSVSPSWLASGVGPMLSLDLRISTEGLTPTQITTLEAFAAVLRSNKLSDNDCRALAQSWSA